MSENAIVAQATEAAVAQASPKNMTGEEALAMVRAEKEKASASAGSKTTPTTAQPSKKEASSTPDPLKEAAKEAARKFKVKVDGEELEIEEEELKRGYAHQKAANKLFQEGKMLRKQSEEYLSMMRDPEKFFETAKKLGHDPRALAEKYLANQLEDELMDPKDKRIRDLESQQALRDQEKENEKKKEEDKLTQTLKTKFAKEYSDSFVAALQESNLPADKITVGEMAAYIGRAAAIGFKLSAKDAATLVEQDQELKAQKKFGKNADVKAIVKFLGPDNVEKIRVFLLEQLKNPEAGLTTPSEQGPVRERRTPSRRMTPREWREYNRKA